jgi:hypothetical protein
VGATGGLSRYIGASGGPETEALARRIVGDTVDEEILELARAAVRAHLDLLRIREVKRDIIERVYRLGALGPQPRFRSLSAEIKYVMRLPLDRPILWPQPIDPLGPMPSDRDERAAEAARRMLPELRKLDRYERRTFNAKQLALRQLANALRF